MCTNSQSSASHANQSFIIPVVESILVHLRPSTTPSPALTLPFNPQSPRLNVIFPPSSNKIVIPNTHQVTFKTPGQTRNLLLMPSHQRAPHLKNRNCVRHT